MFFLVTWSEGERPYINLIPDDPVLYAKLLIVAVQQGRIIEIWHAEAGALTREYPESATMASIIEAGLAVKEP